MDICRDKLSFSKINNLALSPQIFLDECSSSYHTRVSRAAERIFNDGNVKFVMLAGPSSSGKTTTAALLSDKISALGCKAYVVSLDDFYLPHSEEYPTDENGEPDYECVEALDLELMHSSFLSLSESGRAELPVFDFKSGDRINNAKTIELGENDVIIFEGLHALNPVVSDALDAKSLFKIYVSVSSRVYENDGSVLLSKRDLRFIRRMVRDFSFRSMSVERTFDIWGSVMRGEDKYLFPYESLADIKLDSFHPCEPCVLAQKAVELLSQVRDGEFKEKASTLSEKLRLFRNIDYSRLPRNSLLREFTG